ncbi:MAG: S24 family peptidase [Candidatus Heteroscillospira sp.]|jgi:repressor LexA
MIGSKLKAILDERDVNVNELSRRIGVSAQTLYSIIKRDTNKIDFDVLLKICTELEIPVELFYGSQPPPGLPEIHELGFLKKFRELDEHGRNLTEMVLNSEYERVSAARHKPEEKAAKIIPLYATPAAAGYANPALGEDYEDYEVPADSRADFAARIQGDSMEPYIADGSIVLVNRSSPIADGDVGLFFVDGDIKCKQYCEDSFGNIYLLSLNRARSDADTTVMASSGITVFCFGKVLMDKRPPLP